jgi:hypothetical protein
VSKLRSRFQAGRLQGLSDEPCPGRPRQITDDRVERVVTQPLQETPGADTHWSTRSMAAATTTSLFAAMDIGSGSVIAQPYRRHRHQEFLLHPHQQLRHLRFDRGADAARRPELTIG